MLQHEIHVQHIKIPVAETDNLTNRIDSSHLQTAEYFHVKLNILFYFHQRLYRQREKSKNMTTLWFRELLVFGELERNNIIVFHHISFVLRIST